MNAQQIIEWLEDFISTINKPTVVIMDNAPWHRAKIIEDKLIEWEEKNLYIYRLPTYCPHLNIIEILWRKIKYEWLKPKDYENKETLHLAINNILQNFNNEEFNINFTINI